MLIFHEIEPLWDTRLSSKHPKNGIFRTDRSTIFALKDESPGAVKIGPYWATP